MKLKNLLCATVACTAALTLAACGGNAEEPNKPNTPSKPQIDLTGVEYGGANIGIKKDYVPKTEKLTVWGPSSQNEVLKKLTADWTAYMKTKIANFNVTVEVGIVGEPDVKEKLQADLENSADVFAFANNNLVKFQQAGFIAQQGGKRIEYIQHYNDQSAYEATLIASGQCYAYPITGDNGYFLMYNAEVFNEIDVLRFDDMFAKASVNDRIHIDLDDSWYDAGFFFGAGCSYKIHYNEENIETAIDCDFNSKQGLVAGKGILGLYNQGEKLLNGDNDVLTAGVGVGTCDASVTGTWNAPALQEKWGSNFRATKLPKFTVDGQDYQMGSFNGVKLMGVNPKSKDQLLASSLAAYLTSKEAQIVRYEMSKVAPSIEEARKEAEGFKDDVLASALSMQNALPESKVQSSVPGNYWSAVEAFAKEICQGSVSVENMQAKLDQMVKLIKTLTK